MARKTLTDRGVAALRPMAKQYAHPDPQLPGHYIRVNPTGSKSYVCIARDPRGKQIWSTIGNAALIDIDVAREKARTVMLAVKAGADRAGPQSFESVSAEWLHRHVDAKALRSASDIRRYLTKHLLPAWGGREFVSIKRGDVAKLLDQVEDKSGARSADMTLSIVNGICNWYATRNDDYTSPIVRGMRRHGTREHARDRILSDDEIRAVWKLAEANGAFGAFVRLLLLTAQRRDKVASMKWEDISDCAWHVPNGTREKGAGGTLVLPAIAMEVIESRPRMGDNPYVFAGRANSYAKGFGNIKLEMDGKLPTTMPQWGLHDLRRTARSLMSRAGVAPHVSERVLGHSIKGVEGIYDRHAYRDEKADALARLANLVESIVNPSDKVVPMVRRR